MAKQETGEAAKARGVHAASVPAAPATLKRAEARAPKAAARPSALVDTRVIDCGDNLPPLAKLLCALALLALPTFVQAQFSFTTNGEAITIAGYSAAAGRNAVIPAGTNGFPVVSIADNAFQATTIPNVTIPNSIVSIGKYVLFDCECADSPQEPPVFCFSAQTIDLVRIIS